MADMALSDGAAKAGALSAAVALDRAGPGPRPARGSLPTTLNRDRAWVRLAWPGRWRIADPEVAIGLAMICAAAVIGLVTVGDYGITVDEWNADDYGPKALAWYMSGFADRSTFDRVEDTLWYYGPWFHILVSMVQSLSISEHWTVRHAMTFLTGLGGIGLVVPTARLAVGRWAGLAALVLCLTTGYLYGSIFFTPIDVPFLLAMSAATLAIVAMAGRSVPSWRASVAAGLLTGLAIATRSSGVITHVYLIGAMVLAAVDAILSAGKATARVVGSITGRTIAALAIAWATAFALWPWLQAGNPIARFAEAFAYFANHPASWQFVSWGETVTTNRLPWSYVPSQLLARLPEGFLALLAVGLLFGTAKIVRLIVNAVRATAGGHRETVRGIVLVTTRSRQSLVVWVAALLPIAVIIVQRSTMYDGVRHVLFVIPVLAIVASYGFVQLLPVLGRMWPLATTAIGAYLGYLVLYLATLHPLEYVAFNSFIGGVHGAYHRFDMDYWAVAATVALRRLEEHIDIEQPGRFAKDPPHLLICMAWRESMVSPLYRRSWQLETDPAKADYIITTERLNCAGNQPLQPVDQVTRFDRAFAWTYAKPEQPPAR
jgi:hypothetical protein